MIDERINDNTIVPITKELPKGTKISVILGYSRNNMKPSKLKILETVKNLLPKKSVQETITTYSQDFLSGGSNKPDFLIKSEEGRFIGAIADDDTYDLEDGNTREYYLGTFTVNSVKKFKTTNKRYVTVECLSISAVSGMNTSRTRNFYGRTMKDVAETIALETGLNLSIHPSVENLIVTKAQTGQSNQAYLRELCTNVHAGFKVWEGTIYINAIGADTNIINEPIKVFELDDVEDLITWDYEIQDRKLITGVFAKYIDINGGEDIQVFVGNTTGETRQLETSYTSYDSAILGANSWLSSGASSEQIFNFTTDGSKLISAGSSIRIYSPDPDIDNTRFKVVTGNYSLSKGNFRVSYSCEKA
jgi:hypothetical protein